MNLRANEQKILIGIYFILLFILFIYSYAHIDLNLTLSPNPLYQNIQGKLIRLGYYHRDFSTAIFILALAGLFTCYLKFIGLANSRNFSKKSVFKLAILTAIILIFSYPAFSYDLFNYIFDARLVIVHKVNPYNFTALNFPDDLWTRFMHWTHRTYPYGPLWIMVTLPFYLLGLGKFILTLFWFKLIGALSYLGSVLLIGKILDKTNKENSVSGMLLFALNPLIIIESLVSAHLDILMAFLFLCSLYFLMFKRKILLGWLFYLFSAGIKFVTFVTLPVLIWWRGNKQKYLNAIKASLLVLVLATLGLMAIREPLPWYLITPLAVSSLLPGNRKLLFVSTGASMGMLLRYAPYIYYGEYNNQLIFVRNFLTLTVLIIFLIFMLVDWKKRNARLV